MSEHHSSAFSSAKFIASIKNVLFILLIWIVIIELKKWLISKKMKNFGSPTQYPIVGAISRVWGKSNEQILELGKEFFNEIQSPFFVWAGPILVVGVSEPEDLKIILTDEQCLNKPYFYDHMHCKTSIIASKNEMWKRDRRALNPTFTIQHLRNSLLPLNKKLRILVDRMQIHLNDPANIYRTIYIATMDSVACTMLGMDMHFQSERGVPTYNIMKQIMNSIQYRVTRIWLRWDFVYFNLSKVGREERRPLKDGNEIMNEIYVKKVEEFTKSHGTDYLREVKEKGPSNFFEQCLLMEQQGIFTHENLLDQMRMIILAGSDTSSMAVFGTLLMLAINQKHQDLLVEELRSVFESADCEVTQTHLNGLKYTERVIKESMRLLPPTPFTARDNKSNIQLSKGEIPKRTMIIINIMHLHRNPNIWGENALEFDPDRFLPENIAKRHPFSYIPFLAGPRNCIAMKYAMMSAKVTIAYLLRRYKFTSHLQFKDIRLNTNLVTEVANENPIRIEKRTF